jgi:hypothetical protein
MRPSISSLAYPLRFSNSLFTMEIVVSSSTIAVAVPVFSN